MKNVIIITSREPFRINWNDKVFADSNIRLFLIISKFCVDRYHIDKQAEYFQEFIVIDSLDDFTSERLQPHVAKILGTTDVPTLLATHDEYMLLVLAELRQHFGLEGNLVDDLLLFRNKLMMKEVAAKNGFSVPNYTKFIKQVFLEDRNSYIKDIIEKIQLHLIAKPVMEARAKDIALIETEEDLLVWCEAQEEKTDVELEQYIEGTLYNCFVVVIGSQVKHFGVMQYAYPCLEFLTKRKPLGGVILPKEEQMYSELHEFCRTFIHSLGDVPDYSGQVEVFKASDGRIYLLEIAARPAGAVITDIYSKYSGIQLELVHYQIQLGLDVNLVESREGYSAWCWYPKPEGKILKINEPNIKSKYKVVLDAKEGDVFDGPHFLGDRVYSIDEVTNLEFHDLKQDFEFLTNDFVPYEIDGA